MALLDRQRRTRRIGKIRIGKTVTRTTANGVRQVPTALDTFRFTCPSQSTAEAVAELFGGLVVPWDPPGAGRSTEWEVVTDVTAIPVVVPPHEKIVDSFYELWAGAKMERRCDGRQVLITGQSERRPCVCPADRDLRAAQAKTSPPTACKTMTHFQVMIPHLPELGVWALDTASEYAADETADIADLLERAATEGVWLPAELYISRRNRISTGTSYPVPGLRALVGLLDLAHGTLPGGDMRAAMAMLPTPPRYKALGAGPTPPAPSPTPTVGPGLAEADTEIVDAEIVEDRPPGTVTAQDFADRAAFVVVSAGRGSATDLDKIRDEADRHGLLDATINIGGNNGVLANYLRWCTDQLRQTPAAKAG